MVNIMTRQDSPPLPSEFPTVVWRIWLGSKHGEWQVGEPPTHLPESRIETAAIIPLSALLSDEALGELAYRLEALGWQLPADGAETCADLRASVQAVIEQVGGGQGGE